MPEQSFDDLINGSRVGRHRQPGWAAGPHTYLAAGYLGAVREKWAAMWDRDTTPNADSSTVFPPRRIRKAGQ